MKLQRLYSQVRQAIDSYNMIEDGDVIAIGISGGKDSLTLLYALAGLREFYPKSFQLKAITVDLGYDGFDTTCLSELCASLNVEYYLVKTSIKELIKDKGCSLCAKLRKGAFNEKAIALGCNKIAYAHNKDDVVETMLLSLIYEGRFSSFDPVTYLDKTGLTLIRPLVFVSKEDVTGFKNKYKLPVVSNPCPYDSHSERSYVRELLHNINGHTPGVRDRMFTALRGDQSLPW